MLLRKMGILDCRVTSFLAIIWIASATPRSRQAYFVPGKDAENYAVFNVEMELTPRQPAYGPGTGIIHNFIQSPAQEVSARKW